MSLNIEMILWSLECFQHHHYKLFLKKIQIFNFKPRIKNNSHSKN